MLRQVRQKKKRKDYEIINKQLQLLNTEDEHLSSIYKVMTDSILKMYHNVTIPY